jgi:hypothetical protein
LIVEGSLQLNVGMDMNLASRETRRSSRGQGSSENTAENPPLDCGNPNILAAKERDIVIESRNDFRRGCGSVENSSVELRRKTSSLQAAEGKLPDRKLCLAGNSAIVIESTIRKHFTRNKKRKTPEKDEAKDDQQYLVS